VSTEKKDGRRWLIPVALALPFLAALVFAALRWGPTLRDLLHVAIKMVVIS